MSGLFVTSLSSRQLSYYFSGVATGREDSRISLEDEEIEYFGCWSGRRTNSHGLDEIRLEMRRLKVDKNFVRPITNLGYDVCLVAPKQLSILYGLLPVSESQQVLRAHKQAVADVVDTMSSTITWGTGSDLSAAGFVHQSSRALDPHLHTHLVLANRVEVSPGVLRAIDSTELYRRVGEWSGLYRTALARGIYSLLGIVMIDNEFGREGNRSDIPGFPAELAELFSKRSREVQDLVAAWGTRSPTASRVASLITRSHKVNLDSDGLRNRWRNELSRCGFSVGQVAALVPKSRSHVRDQVGGALLRRARPDQSHLSEMGRRTRGDGWLKVVSFEDDLYQRMKAFSLGSLVGVIPSGRRSLDRPMDRKLPEQALGDPVEVVILGRTDLETVASLAREYRHQNLIIACGREFYERSGMAEFLPMIPAGELAPGRLLSTGAENLASLEADKSIGSSPEVLGELVRGAAEALSNRDPGAKLDAHLIFATRRDRDLARAEIAQLLGRTAHNSGFYDSEPVWVHFLPARGSSYGNHLGEVDVAGEGIWCRVNDSTQLIPFSKLNTRTMISPLSAMTLNDARRAWGQGLNREIAVNEFARVDGSLSLMEVFSENEPTRRLTADEFGKRQVEAPEAFQRFHTRERVSVDDDFWRHI